MSIKSETYGIGNYYPYMIFLIVIISFTNVPCSFYSYVHAKSASTEKYILTGPRKTF